ncbi:MAG: hypothetical protein AAF658_17915, partial [Myxococcota bacterium]
RMMIYLDRPLERIAYVEAKGFLTEGPDSELDSSCEPARLYDASCPPWQAQPGLCTPQTCERNPDRSPVAPCVCGQRASYNIGQIGRSNRDEYNEPWGNYFIDGFKADCWKDTEDPPFPTQEWFCLSWEVNPREQRARFYMNDVEIEGLRFGLEDDGTGELVSTDPRFSGCLGGRETIAALPELDTLRIGANPSKEQPAHTIWIDDIVVDDAPVSCR